MKKAKSWKMSLTSRRESKRIKVGDLPYTRTTIFIIFSFILLDRGSFKFRF
jgi:hypothetical protein